MTRINKSLLLLAQQFGRTFHTPGPTRAIRSMCFTSEQLEALAERPMISVNLITEVLAHSHVLRDIIGRWKSHAAQ